MKTKIIAMMIALAGAACSPQAPPSATVNRTIVILNPNGEPTVKRDVITAEQHEQERSEHAALSATSANGIGEHAQALDWTQRDYSCAGSSLWIFDNPGNVRGPYADDSNEICFFRNGFNGCSDLSKYFRFCNIFGCNWADLTGDPNTGGAFSYMQSY